MDVIIFISDLISVKSWEQKGPWRHYVGKQFEIFIKNLSESHQRVVGIAWRCMYLC